ncbi:MAG: DUF86 domain-containing protein [Candidatus Omnitrophota bacterium]|nr:DUF86 domain-containing protein [Candidatus Omnitrophota bacterium]
MREYKLYLIDILAAAGKIEKFTKGITLAKFRKNELVMDAVIRNLEIIGEASKKLPETFKKNMAGIEWHKIAGLRNILIHEYFGVDAEILWDIIKNKLPELKREVRKYK